MERRDQILLANIQSKLSQLEELLKEVTDHWIYEDRIYRFYYQSFKVYSLQESTEKIAGVLLSLSPSGKLDPFFQEILESGTGKTFDISHNKNWLAHTRPIVEAFFHAKYFLEMAVEYGSELAEVPERVPSGWAALMCLYEMR